MLTDKPYRRHLRSVDDLITPYEATRAGFVALALERNRRATPFVEQARALKSMASAASTPVDLPAIKSIQPALLTAAGVSDKAASHMTPRDILEAIQGLIRNFLEPAGPAFVEELVYRFLLTRGDTLGGSMRNVGGELAKRKLARALISTLTLAGTQYHWFHSETNQWVPAPKDDSDIELSLRGLAWTNSSGPRTVLYNLNVPLVKKNVDVCLLDCAYSNLPSNVSASPSAYLALGELKGGVDPAGADEHWKTARSALDRVNQAFAKESLSPKLFFVGAAVESHMASEIWERLQSGWLTNAANLTSGHQVASISQWLCDL